MERLREIQQIYAKLSRLEDSREEALLANKPTEEFDLEITAIRDRLKVIMNEVCPVIKGSL